MTITRIKNIKEVENKEPTSESAFLHRAGSTDYYATMEQMENYLAEKTDAKIAAETTARQEADTALQANIDTEATTRETNDAALQTNIDTEVSDRKAAVSAEENARKEADAALQTQVTANKTAIDTLNGTGEGSVTKTVADKIAEVVSDAPEDFDTLKEISDWISSHENDASAMNTAIQANKTGIETNTSDIASLKAADTTLQGNIDSEASAREAADTALEERTAANETGIADLKTADETLQADIDKKLDKTTDTANAGKVVAVEDDGSLGFKSVGISIDDTSSSSETTYSSSKIDTELEKKVTAADIATAIQNANSKSGASTHTLALSESASGTIVTKYVHLFDVSGADSNNGVIEIYAGGNGNGIVDSFKITTTSTSGATLKQLLRADFTKHAVNRGITAAYVCTTSYSGTKEIWLKIVYNKNPKYYFMANTFLTSISEWYLAVQDTAPSNITTTLDLSDLQCGTKTA